MSRRIEAKNSDLVRTAVTTTRLVRISRRREDAVAVCRACCTFFCSRSSPRVPRTTLEKKILLSRTFESYICIASQKLPWSSRMKSMEPLSLSHLQIRLRIRAWPGSCSARVTESDTLSSRPVGSLESETPRMSRTRIDRHWQGNSVSLMYSDHAQLVVTVLCYVTYPGQGLVSTLLDDFQIAYLDPRNCEVGDFKFDLDRCLPTFWILT